MRLIGKKKLEKYKRKNRGDFQLDKDVDKLVVEIETHEWSDQTQLKIIRPDADCVHSDGFYFFNINTSRTMILIAFEDKEATVVWIGDHQAYTNTFKNNRNTIRKWLKDHNYI